jgi:PP-loop superfamily ATP-utilizing enzyme
LDAARAHLIQHIKAANQEKRKSDKEAIICLAKMISENRNTKNIDLQMMEYQNRVIIENFWKNMNRERERERWVSARAEAKTQVLPERRPGGGLQADSREPKRAGDVRVPGAA